MELKRTGTINSNVLKIQIREDLVFGIAFSSICLPDHQRTKIQGKVGFELVLGGYKFDLHSIIVFKLIFNPVLPLFKSK